jgi:phenylpropionate dioxygenase-like ring-hydroxylating dioxygenase large terminal subunit
MFTSQHHLQHLLRPSHYTSEEHYRAELRHLFLPAWHPVAVKSDLARPGDFVTHELVETPFIIRNFDGELRAFLNICPHRHSRLTLDARGNTEKFRCRYHGWEFTKDGRTGKIPDARAFRPWDRENSCLKSFHVDTCADLVYVNFSDNPVPLREWIGPLWDVWQSYGGAFRHALTWEKEFPCNWKIVLENSLESYHIPEIHPTTFKEFPPEENAWHELEPRFSSFRTVAPIDFALRIQNWIVRRLGQVPDGVYMHRVLYPHATGSSLDSFRMMQCVFPTGPTTCRYRCIFFTIRGHRVNPLAWVLYRLLRSVATLVGKKVFVEDGSIYEGVQRGIDRSPHPGVIGTREERVYQFQKYVLDNTRGPRELPQIDPAPANGQGAVGCAG